MVDAPKQKNATGKTAEQTRVALIHAGLALFGEKGFTATATREIAGRASANIGSIAYHFGSKDGLREACARHIVDTIGAVAGPVLDADPPNPGGDPDKARARLMRIVDTMVSFIVVRAEAREIAQFVLREMSQPSPALDIIYFGLFERLHKRLCATWEQATGEPAGSEETMLTVFTLIGQVIYFRVGREAVLRRLGWDEIGPDNAQKISAAAKANLAAMLDARKGGGS